MKKFLIGLCLTLSLLGGMQVNAQEDLTPANSICNSQTTDLKMATNKLWTDHVFWSRNFIISDISNLGNNEAVEKRLLRNQDELGNLIKPYYGEDVGNAFAKLLREHIQIAGQVIDSAKKNDSESLDNNNKIWYENADEIARFLSEINPYWDYLEMKELFYIHLDLLTDQVTAFLNEDWSGAIEAHDEGEEHMFMLSKAMYDGIITQFPEKFE